MEKYYIVKYSGIFGFIKPWTAVRDSDVFSQQFLTPSIIEGIEKKLFPELLNRGGEIIKIAGHRLRYDQISEQQEVVQPRGWNSKRKGKQYLFTRPTSILIRGVMINPTLHLAFHSLEDARQAATQHICLCRNEDLLFPEELQEVSIDEFNSSRFPGFELVFEKEENSFLVGYNRYTHQPMYGWLRIVGNPVGQITY